jgi:hypothetical protein
VGHTGNHRSTASGERFFYLEVVVMDIEMFDRPIAFHRSFVPFAGITGALLLSQAIYWQARTKSEDGFFYKTAEEWEEETGLTQREQSTARARLRELGILEEVKKGIPCKCYFRINVQNLNSVMCKTSFDKSAKLDSTKARNLIEQKRETITEITTETTTETTHNTARAKNANAYIAELWSNLFNVGITIDSALERRITKAIQEYGIENVEKTVRKYHWAVTSKDSWVENTVTLFSFFNGDNSKMSFSRFYHETKETLTKSKTTNFSNGEEPRAKVTKTGTGAFAC